ncbi:hypothetical protein LOKO_01435 [Halomonas chromatireducens]|uniref:Uncharacterized protein n=1 Tax=Halomonas chromatireducens TaxID=507626 RepID=A0A109ULG4_9GAMM|nr:hypothetical protein LOKO_01435 [Halomonas chromatireducens]
MSGEFQHLVHYEAQIAQGGLIVVGGAQVFLEGRGQRRIDDPLANLGTHPRQLGDVVDVKPVQSLINALVEPLMGQELAIGVGGGGETAGDCDAGSREV